MKVALVNLTGGGLSGGYKRWLDRMLPRLASDPRVAQLDVFFPPGVAATPFLQQPNHHSWPARDAFTGFRRLRASLIRLQPDVVFFRVARWLHVEPIPSVVMVHNMEPLVAPFGRNRLPERLKNLARAAAARRACLRATRVIAVSGYVKSWLVDHWALDSQKIGVVRNGAERLNGTEIPEPESPQPTPQPGFLFTAGSIRPARGLEDALVALSGLRNRGIIRQLVVAGQVDPGCGHYQRFLNHLVASLDLLGRVVWAGNLSPRQMRWCYENCSLFVMTSRAEACPSTALEAIAYGSRCVSTDTPPMPEIFGPAADYYRGRDGGGLANAIELALSEPPDRSHEMKARAARQAIQFDWDRTASATVEQLMAAASSRGPTAHFRE